MTETLYCANHPDRETTLRCNKCGKPICSKCAVRTPVGYRCPECVRGQQAIFQTAEWYDYVIGAAVALVLSGIMTPFGGALGWFFSIFLGPVGGAVVAEAVRFAVRKRRGRYFAELVGGAMIVGGLPILLLPLLLGLLLGGSQRLGGLFGLLGPIIFLSLAVGTAYARLRGLTFR